MAETILFPDAENELRLHLIDALPVLGSTATPYAALLPSAPAVPSVLVRRTGGPRRSLVIDGAQLTFECRAKYGSDAAILADKVRGIVAALARAGGNARIRVYASGDLGGLYLDPDPDRPDVPRYTFTASLDIRGAAA